MTRGDGLLLTALLAVAALPFQSNWLDFELARRGVVMGLAAVFAFRLHARWPAPLPRAAVWFGAFVVWSGVAGVAGSTNPGEAFLRVAYYVALFFALVHGTAVRERHLAVAAAVVGSAVSVYGIAQWLGLEWPAGYARTQAVSSLGNRNVASEFVALCATACAASTVRGGPRALCVGGAAICAVYLGLNGSRSGLLALGLGAACASAFAQGQRPLPRALPIGLAGLALVTWLVGSAASPAVPASPSVPANTAAPPPALAPSTIEVRKEIWLAGARMVADAPLAGHGTGQFRYEYPRYRSAREIDLSGFGRRFAHFAPTAHNDHLEIAIEGGLVAALLWIAFLVSIVRAVGLGSATALAPVLAFAALAAVRSPLGNGPAALLAFTWIGSVVARGAEPAAPRRARTIAVALIALATAAYGAAVLCAQWAFAGYRALPPTAATERDARLATATACHPTESRFHQLRLRNAWRPGRPDAATPWVETVETRHWLAELDPNNPTALMYLAEFAHAAGDVATSERHLERLLAIDPPNPEGRLLRTVQLCQAGRTREALDTLYTHLHESLRQGLAGHLRDLAAMREPTSPADAELLRREQHIVAAVEASRTDPVNAPPLFADERDPRTLVIVAYRVLARGDRDRADARAPETLELDAAARGLLAPLLDRLAELPRWRRLIVR